MQLEIDSMKMDKKVLILLFVILVCTYWAVNGQEPLYPRYSLTQTLVSSSDFDSANYLAFPSILRLNDDEILISFKRGAKHGGDGEAAQEMIHFNTKSNRVIDQRVLARDSGLVHQMGEWVRFPDNSIHFYIDSQNTGDDKRHYRTGMRELQVIKMDTIYIPGKTRRAPIVGEREYGYPFDFIVDGESTYMLVMGFGYRPGEKWSVDVIRSTDNGDSWSLVRDLSKELGGHKINESAFIPWKDGFIVTTREYGHNQRIFRTDKDFKLVKEANLSKGNDFIESHIGRPRLFSKDGNIYLLGRNWRTMEKSGRLMELGLFRIDPVTLTIDKWVVLDNKDRATVSDGYYAAPFFQEKDGTTYFNVINYKGANGNNPDITRHEFIWDEVK